MEVIERKDAARMNLSFAVIDEAIIDEWSKDEVRKFVLSSDWPWITDGADCTAYREVMDDLVERKMKCDGK
jgi:hypothetical protein